MTETLQPPLLRDDRDGVTTLTFNRPRQLNSMSEELLAALDHELDTIEDDPRVRVLVLASTGRAFSTGHDLKQVRARPEEAYYQDLFAHSARLMLRLQRLPQPVIAKVEGIATAAGCQLVATCDLAVATPEATFAVSGINLGLFCSTPSVALSRNVSRKQAFEMLFTGEFISAEQALAEGLVNRVTPPEEIDAVVEALARNICSKSRNAVTIGKRMFYEQIERDPASAYEYASEVMASNMMDHDAREGVGAFLDKRPARFED